MPCWVAFFGVKEARACLFAGLFFAAVWVVPRAGVLGIVRYDLLLLIALLIYLNFFTQHYIGDWRWYIAAAALWLYARATVIFRPMDRDWRMPLLLSFVLIGFFIWLAENLSTLLRIWTYPNQLGAWSVVHVGVGVRGHCW